MDIRSLQPFEICSIRPPTENNSLTFRITRNCAWNRCIFCPVYKMGAKFSRRTIDEIREDVNRAVMLDHFSRQKVSERPVLSRRRTGRREVFLTRSHQKENRPKAKILPIATMKG